MSLLECQTYFTDKLPLYPTQHEILSFVMCYNYLDYSIHFKFANFSFFPYSFGIEMINMFTHSVVPSKTIPDSRPKWAKCISVFRPKGHKNPTRWDGTYYPYDLYTGVAPSPPPPPPGVPPGLDNNYSLPRCQTQLPFCSKP